MLLISKISLVLLFLVSVETYASDRPVGGLVAVRGCDGKMYMTEVISPDLASFADGAVKSFGKTEYLRTLYPLDEVSCTGKVSAAPSAAVVAAHCATCYRTDPKPRKCMGTCGGAVAYCSVLCQYTGLKKHRETSGCRKKR